MYADMHCDTLTAVEDVAKGNGQISLDKLRQADCFVQCFAVFLRYAEGDLLRRFDDYADKFDALCASYPYLAKVTAPKEAEAARAEGKVAALLTVEEGGVLEGKMDNLLHLYRRGVRMVTLTWNYPNELGYPNVNLLSGVRKEQLYHIEERGLTRFGIDVVGQMNALSMLVDVSHLSDGGFWDVLRYSQKPVVASHSNARALCPVARNLSDEMLSALADKGGVAGLNFCYDFLTDQGGDVLSNALRHVRHVYEVAGEDVLALGSDFDGIRLADGWDSTKMPLLAECLHTVLPAKVVDKMLWQNFLRVWQNA